jgi:hypothetical protein
MTPLSQGMHDFGEKSTMNPMKKVAKIANFQITSSPSPRKMRRNSVLAEKELSTQFKQEVLSKDYLIAGVKINIADLRSPTSILISPSQLRDKKKSFSRSI